LRRTGFAAFYATMYDTAAHRTRCTTLYLPPRLVAAAFLGTRTRGFIAVRSRSSQERLCQDTAGYHNASQPGFAFTFAAFCPLHRRHLFHRFLLHHRTFSRRRLRDVRCLRLALSADCGPRRCAPRVHQFSPPIPRFHNHFAYPFAGFHTSRHAFGLNHADVYRFPPPAWFLHHWIYGFGFH